MLVDDVECKTKSKNQDKKVTLEPRLGVPGNRTARPGRTFPLRQIVLLALKRDEKADCFSTEHIPQGESKAAILGPCAALWALRTLAPLQCSTL